MAPPLIMGYQHCENANPPGINHALWGQQLCMTPDGSGAGHMNYWNMSEGYQCGPDGSGYVACFLNQRYTDFWMATLAGENLTWTQTSAGAAIPTNAYKVAGLLIGRSLLENHNIIPGYVKPQADKLGDLTFEDYGAHQASTYELATCHPPTHLPFICNNQTHQCQTAPSGTPGSQPTQQQCAATCIKPPAPPPPPLTENPCIRFGRE